MLICHWARGPAISDLPLDHVDFKNEIHMLIGSDQTHLIQPIETRRDPNGKNIPFATRSYFGWSLSGPVPMMEIEKVAKAPKINLESEKCSYVFHTGFNNKRQNGGLRSDSMSQNTGRSSVQRPQVKSVPNIEKRDVVPRHTKIIYSNC